LRHGVYTLWGTLAPNSFLLGAKFTLHSKSCVLLYLQHYCMALEQWASAKLCIVVSSRDRMAILFDIGWSNCIVHHLFLLKCLVLENYAVLGKMCAFSRIEIKKFCSHTVSSGLKIMP